MTQLTRSGTLRETGCDADNLCVGYGDEGSLALVRCADALATGGAFFCFYSSFLLFAHYSFVFVFSSIFLALVRCADALATGWVATPV